MDSIIYANQEEFTNLLVNGNTVVVDVYADWCRPCKVAAPHFKRLAEKYREKAKFVKIDADREGHLVASMGVVSIPTFFIYKNGKPVARVIGADIPKLEKLIETHLGKEEIRPIDIV